MDSFLPQTEIVADRSCGSPSCQRSRSDSPSRTSCLGSFSSTWVPSEGSVQVLRPENVRCRQIRASIRLWSLLTFSCTMRKFRSRPVAAFLPRALTLSQPSCLGSDATSTHHHHPPPGACWDPWMGELCPIGDSEDPESVKVSRRMWAGSVGVGGGGGGNHLPALLQKQRSTGGQNCPLLSY